MTEPRERIHYAGRRWKAQDVRTLRTLRLALDAGTFPRVFAEAALDGRLQIDEDPE